jgi:hypothetical protein
VYKVTGDKKMKNILKLFGISILLLTINSACVSMWSHKNWKEAKQQQAVRVEADGETVFVGVDLTAGAYFKDNFGIALAAGLADAALIYGSYTVLNDMFGEGSGANGGRNSTTDGNASRDSDNDSNNISITINQ